MNLVQELERRRFRWTCISGTLLLGWLMRLVLIARGGLFYNPDEYRYSRSIGFLHSLMQGDFAHALHFCYTYPQHNGSVLIGAIPAAIQGILDKLGWPPEQTMHIAAAIFALVPIANALLVYGIIRRLGRGHAAAFLGLFIMSVSCTMVYCSRHLLPYYSGLCVALLTTWWMLGNKPGTWRLVLAGAAAFAVFLVYNGFWSLSLALLGVLVLLRPPSHPSMPLRGAWLGLGYVLCFAGVYLVGQLAATPVSAGGRGANFIRGLGYFSDTISQGDFADGWWLGWAHLFSAEGVLLPVLLVCAAFSFREGASARMPLFFVLGLYVLLVLGSVVLRHFVVYGRNMIPLYTALIIAGSVGASTLWRKQHGVFLAVLLVVILQSAFRYSRVVRQDFPAERLAEVKGKYPDLSLAFSVKGPRHHADGAYPDGGRYVFVNYRVLSPIQGAAPLPKGRVLHRWRHPVQDPLYRYNGYTRHERSILRQADVEMRLVDTRAEPEPR